MFSSFFSSGASDGLHINNDLHDDEVGVDILEAMDILRLDPKKEKTPETFDIVKSESTISASSSGVFSDKVEETGPKGRALVLKRKRRVWVKRKRRTRAVPLLGLPGVDWKNFSKSARCRKVAEQFAAALKKEAKAASGGIKRFFPSANKNAPLLWSSANHSAAFHPLVAFHSANGYTSDAVAAAVAVTDNSVSATEVASNGEGRSRVLFDVQTTELDTVAFDEAGVCLVRLR